MSYYSNYQNAISTALNGLEATDAEGRSISSEEAMEQWVDLSRKTLQDGGKHYFAGNGASAMMASHMSVDCTKNAGLPSNAFNDAAYLTAIGNDLGYENTFSFPLEQYGRGEDLLITISSSGNSPNILKALEMAGKLGMASVTLSGMKPDNRSRSAGDLNFYIPARTYGIVECTHQVVLHCWLDKFMNIFEWEAAEND